MWRSIVLACVVAMIWGSYSVGCTPTPQEEPKAEGKAPGDGGDKGDAGPPEARPAEKAGEKVAEKEPLPPPYQKISELKAGQWNMVTIPKEMGAICSRGSDYAFFVKPGKSDKLIVDFEGGGACWNAATCSIGDAIFKDSIDNLRRLLKEGYNKGIYDANNPKNPFTDWTHVLVPYCTGDIHWGNNQVTYTPKSGEPFTINHKGAVNTRAILKWTYENVKTPKKVFVTGCSAGAYGSIMWSAHLAKQYKDAKLYQFGDSGVGIVTKNFLKDSFPQWKAEQASPAFVEGLDPAKVDIPSQDLGYMYLKIAAHFPNLLFSQYNTAFDQNQVFYFTAMGGGKNKKEWSDQMFAMMKKIQDGAANFRGYIAPGDKHCIIPYNEVYTYEVGGTKLIDWLKDMVEGKEIKNLSCEGAACDKTPPKAP